MVGEHSDGNRCEWKGNERFGAGGVHSCELRYLAGKNGKWGPRIEDECISYYDDIPANLCDRLPEGI